MWILLWVHLALVLGFLVYLPYSKHLHIATSRDQRLVGLARRPRGALEPLRIDMDALEAGEQSLGAETLPGLTQKSLLDLGACTECGRCQSACPAWNTGKPLSPKLLIMDLRDHALDGGTGDPAARAAGEALEPLALVPDVVDDEAVWACTTCGACVQECPVDIEHVDTIVDLRRAPRDGRVAVPRRGRRDAAQPREQLQPVGTAAVRSAPTGPTDSACRVVNGTAPEVLYWVGCAGSFDDRAKQISPRGRRAAARGRGCRSRSSGPRELCTGDPARRMGNEFLFQTLAEQNVETLNGVGVRTIVANCPHCFNTLRNEYPRVRRDLRGAPPHAAARAAGRARGG